MPSDETEGPVKVLPPLRCVSFGSPLSDIANNIVSGLLFPICPFLSHTLMKKNYTIFMQHGTCSYITALVISSFKLLNLLS